ncbi:hypothetical protein LCGC14_0313360 [marine sediment metagenome]|uniref:Uncharacterized protein n=1 Tax=marine sediment metagenome TaxID=412755 RepID=A0A0F9TRV5_9ZZZZ
MSFREASKWFAIPLVIGLVLILAALLITGEHKGAWFAFLLAETGIAILIACVLGLVFESYLRQKALDDIVRAVLGYLLPPSIRGEMTWLTNITMVRRNYYHRFTIEILDGASVLLREYSSYDIQNISSHTQTLKIRRSIDEYHYGIRQSEIIRVGYLRAGNRCEFSGSELPVTRTVWSLEFEHEIKDFAPKEIISVWSETIQVRRPSDQEVTIIIHATEKPEVEVQIPDNFSYEVGMQHRERREQLSPHRYRLRGTLLPYQGFGFRWWPKSLEVQDAQKTEAESTSHNQD